MTMPSDETGTWTEPPVEHSSGEPAADEIARRAYELYERRGRIDGRHLEDWLAAEAELAAERRAAGAGAVRSVPSRRRSSGRSNGHNGHDGESA